ncbi:SAM domain and HD, partial [Perkinsus olseni]
MSSHNENDVDVINEATPASTVAVTDDLHQRKLIQVDFQGKTERFSFKSTTQLLTQLKYSFSLENARAIELRDVTVDAVVPLGELEDGGHYTLKVVGLKLAFQEGFSTQCPVHRLITLPDICRYIIDTPYFQRLRNETQLGAAGYVFMGATHTRFEHSIGAAYLA